MSILIIDDHLAFRTMLAMFLQDAGYMVVSACDGRDALTYLRQCMTLPGLLLLDWAMPVMSGRDFMREQQRDAKLASIPVVVLTARADVEKECEHLPIAALLDKPMDLETLVTTIQHHYAPSLSARSLGQRLHAPP